MKDINLIKKKLINGPGYAIFSIEKLNIFKDVRNSIFKRIKNVSNNDVNSVRKSISRMNNSEINDLTVKLAKSNKLSEMIINSSPKLIKKLCGKKLFIQRRAHTVIKLPGKTKPRTLPHYEMMSGISPYTYVIWAPMHDIAEHEGGIYYINIKKSSKIMKQEHRCGIVNGPKILNMKFDEKPVTMKFGQAIIFNPFVMHGNNPFKSKLARIAVNVRFQSLNMPLLQKNSDYLKYYEFPN
tara:strand:+ start:125 stop:841 length:717 start_codon:yes stop_codon:yes gene_type:complete